MACNNGQEAIKHWLVIIDRNAGGAHSIILLHQGHANLLCAVTARPSRKGTPKIHVHRHILLNNDLIIYFFLFL